MSRSYKKNPIVKSGAVIYKRFAKRQSNKLIRQTPNIADGNSYKKVYPSWNIYDYVSYCPFEERGNNLTVDEWEKWYLRK